MILNMARRIYRIAKFPLTLIRREIRNKRMREYVSRHVSQPPVTPESFDLAKYKHDVLSFIKEMQTDASGIRFKYAASCSVPNIYSSAYVCMIYSLLGMLDDLDEKKKADWIAYFNSFQRESDGLFIDESIRNQHFDDSDWWGARHLVVHMVSVYIALGARPKYPFRFLEVFYDLKYLESWLSDNDHKFMGDMENDIDNKILNIGAALQYQRDAWGDQKAAAAVTFLQQYLRKKINPQTGIWGDNNITNPALRSRKVQFAYHLFPLFTYDNVFDFDLEKIEKVTLDTQNDFGGFAPASNSSACEDIDSIDVLLDVSKGPGRNTKIDNALKRGFSWVMYNQMSDGGFVFRLNEPFFYGDAQMSSKANEGALFPTWFRTLSLAHMCRYFKLPYFNIKRSPGGL